MPNPENARPGGEPKVAVITGASSGIGRALAKTLAAAPDRYRVGLIARRTDRLIGLADEIRATGGTAAIAQADVGERAGLSLAMNQLADQLGPIDLLVANAGVGSPTKLMPLNVPDQEQLMRTNYFGVVYAVAAVLPLMLRRRTGHIAAVSSLAAYKGLPGAAGYCASKAAVNNFLEGLRIQLRSTPSGKNIAVTTICPGFVHTEMTEEKKYMPLVMSPEDAARRIARALRRRKKVYNFPWPMALGIKLARWLPDFVMARRVPQ